MINPGKYRHQIDIYEQKRKSGSHGVELYFQLTGHRRCYVVPSQKQQTSGDQGEATSITYDIYLRLDNCITTSNQIFWNGKTLQIESILILDVRREMQLRCVEHE